MIGGVLSDIYAKEDRNTPMAIFSGAAFFGTGLGPMVSGIVAQNTSWRWIYYVQAIMSAVLLILVTTCFRETRGSVLLRRKALTLNQYYDYLERAGFQVSIRSSDREGDNVTQERVRWEAEGVDDQEALGKTIMISLYRPLSIENQSSNLPRNYADL
jgi:MFS family permease